MAKTGRLVAAGTKFFGNLTGTTPLAQIAGIVSLGGPSMTADNIDITELDPYEGTSTLPANPEFWKEFVAGWRDLGQVELTMNFTRAQWSTLLTYFRRGNTGDWEIRLRNGDVMAFSGHIPAVGSSFEKDGMIQNTITIKGTGALTFTPGA